MRLTISVLDWDILTIELVTHKPIDLATVLEAITEADDDGELFWPPVNQPDMDGADSVDWGRIISEKKD